MSEKLHIKPSNGPCEVHDWSDEDWRTKFVPLLRARHGKGGLDVCRECIMGIRERLYGEERPK